MVCCTPFSKRYSTLLSSVGIIAAGVMLIHGISAAENGFDANNDKTSVQTTNLLPAAYGSHESKELRWQLITLSQYPGCSNYLIQKTNLYTELTQKYLDLYNLDHANYWSDCMSEEKYYSEYTPPQDLDMIILILEEGLGREQLHSEKMGGVYIHKGEDKRQNHAIVICDCANFYFSQPTWILTHELAHFSLNYLGYEDVETYIHQKDDQFDACTEHPNKQGCEGATHRLELDSQFFSVVPVPEQAQKKAKGFDPDKDAPKKDNKGHAVIPSDFKEINKQVTKWYLHGKISTQEYVDAISKTMLDSDNKRITGKESLFGQKELVLSDPPRQEHNRPTWQDVHSDIANKQNADNKSKKRIDAANSNIDKHQCSNQKVLGQKHVLERNDKEVNKGIYKMMSKRYNTSNEKTDYYLCQELQGIKDHDAKKMAKENDNRRTKVAGTVLFDEPTKESSTRFDDLKRYAIESLYNEANKISVHSKIRSKLPFYDVKAAQTIIDNNQTESSTAEKEEKLAKTEYDKQASPSVQKSMSSWLEDKANQWLKGEISDAEFADSFELVIRGGLVIPEHLQESNTKTG